jgi:hypothetical protein
MCQYLGGEVRQVCGCYGSNDLHHGILSRKTPIEREQYNQQSEPEGYADARPTKRQAKEFLESFRPSHIVAKTLYTHFIEKSSTKYLVEYCR